MNNKELVAKLDGEYAKIYEKIAVLCHNLSFFMDDSDYFKIDILDETLDLLLEAKVNNQPVEVIFGNDLYQFITNRYKLCYDYSYSYFIFFIVLFVINRIINNTLGSVSSFYQIGIEYYLLLLTPIISRVLYLFNQWLCLKVLFKMKIVINTVIARCVFIGESILLIISMRLIYSYLTPLSVNDVSGWFIASLLFAYLSTLLLKGLKKSKLIYQGDHEELLDQYLTHCHFIKTRRQVLKDIPLTNQDYFNKLQKRHKYFKLFFPLLVIGQIITLILTIQTVQLSIFYTVIVYYNLRAFYNYYRYYQIKDMIDNICVLNIQKG